MEGFQKEAVILALPEMIEAFFATVLFLLLLFSLPFFRTTVERKEKERNTRFPRFFRLGGVALILSFWLILFFDTHIVSSLALTALLGGSMAILVFGLLDDFFSVSWPLQLLFQGGLGFLLIFFGLRIDVMQGLFGGTWNFSHFFIPGFPLLLVFLWLFLILNTLNWIDGIDGLLGSISLIGFLTLFGVSLFPEVRQPTLSILSLVISGSLAAFLLFNWPPGRILAGTTGAYFLGFTLATLAIFAGAKVATALLVLTVPILDALFVLSERFFSGVSLFLPDKRHLHYRLREIGWNDRQILLLYGAITMVMAVLAVSTHALGKLIAFGSVAFFLLLLLVFLSWFTRFSQKKI